MAVDKGFKRAFLDSAAEALNDGLITKGDWRIIRFTAAFRPRKLAEVKEFVSDKAVAAGLMEPGDVDDTAFDWTQLLAFIKELLPLILQLIAIFS